MQKKTLLYLFLVCFILFFSGCATAPRSGVRATYSLNGTTYFSLPAFCDANNVDWQYDVFSRTAALVKDSHKINLRVGDNLLLVDGSPVHLNHPIDIYQGIIVGPYKFRQEVLEVLFGREKIKERTPEFVYKIRKIVLDPGHGGGDPGAIGKSGLREKDINLDITKRLASLLKKEDIEIVMTRASDRFIPLGSRVDIANASGADLFISIHSNANRVRSLNGFEVYYVASTVNDSKRALFAAKNVPLKNYNSSFGGNSTDLKAILWDMIYTNNRAESIELSYTICSSIREELDVKVLGIKGGRFEVLRGVRIPGVLVEVGFVSNREEESKLKNSYYRQKIAEAIAAGIKNYCRNFTIIEASRR